MDNLQKPYADTGGKLFGRSSVNISLKDLHTFNLTEVALMPLVSFYTPWKHRKTRSFQAFSEGLVRNQWHEMG